MSPGKLDRRAVPASRGRPAARRYRRVGRRVDVGDQTDDRCVGVSWHGREDVAVLGQLDVARAELAQLVREQPRELELLGRARIGLGAVGGLRVDPHVAEEAVERVGGELLRERARVPRASRAIQGGGTPPPPSRRRAAGARAGMRSLGAWRLQSGSAKPVRIAGIPRAASAGMIGSVPPVRKSSGRVRPRARRRRAELHGGRVRAGRGPAALHQRSPRASAPAGAASRMSRSNVGSISSTSCPGARRIETFAWASTGKTVF